MARAHEHWMRRAVALSRRGFPAPNPHVGCVIVRDGSVVGEGWHAAAGGPHAEAMALAEAGERARGATVYVTLEPCAHHGRTPPCADALVRAGVVAVHVACQDPNPVAAGGVARLREAGIDVTVGLGQRAAARANEQFLTALSRGRPYVVLKAAVTLDGRMARPDGSSQWITGPAARAEAHRLRAECGAVLVGRGTVEADDPLLTARLPGVQNQPMRVVLDPDWRLAGREWRVFDGSARTLWLGHGEPPDPRGTSVEPGLEAALETVREAGATGVLVEGGPKVLSSFWRAGLWDRLDLFVGPSLFGGGPRFDTEPGVGLMLRRARRFGPDLHFTYGPERPEAGNTDAGRRV
jgi:diaminohydroxyphosphoribosylaminopyrimidine deaminase / 5-amino-6-(5-phosphoribosylamino)uracil reductase